MATADGAKRPYYRGDQTSGITGPNLAKTCTFAEHICRARGKRTQYTSVSLDQDKIRDFGDAVYRLKRDEVDDDGHATVEHETLVESLRRTIQEQEKAERAKAIQALRRANRRREGLVSWNFDISSVPSAQLMKWAQDRVQKYFQRV